MSKLTVAALGEVVAKQGDILAAILQRLEGNAASTNPQAPPMPSDAELLAKAKADYLAASNPNPKYAAANPPPPYARQEKAPFVPCKSAYQGKDKKWITLADFGYIGGKPFSMGPGKCRMILAHLDLLREVVAIDDLNNPK